MLNYPRKVSEHRAMKLFVDADKNNDGELTSDEFEKAVDKFDEETSNDVLAMMGLSSKHVMIAVGMLVVILLLAFTFIFLGILAFATPGAFESSINSLLPVLSGVGASKGTEEDVDDGDNEKLTELLDEVGSTAASFTATPNCVPYPRTDRSLALYWSSRACITAVYCGLLIVGDGRKSGRRIEPGVSVVTGSGEVWSMAV